MRWSAGSRRSSSSSSFKTASMFFVTVRRSSFGAACIVGHRRLAGNTVGCLSGLFSGPLDGCLPDLLGFGATFTLGADFLEFVVGEMLDADERVLRCADSD